MSTSSQAGVRMGRAGGAVFASWAPSPDNPLEHEAPVTDPRRSDYAAGGPPCSFQPCDGVAARRGSWRGPTPCVDRRRLPHVAVVFLLLLVTVLLFWSGISFHADNRPLSLLLLGLGALAALLLLGGFFGFLGG